MSQTPSNSQLSIPPNRSSQGVQSPYIGLAFLVAVNVLNYMDRQIVSVLLPHIRADLGLSMSQGGLLTGLAFAVTYATVGLPIARWADKANRVFIVSGALFVWSGMTALCGMATNFIQLLLARIGVGIGEAGCGPPSHSLIGDLFPPESRTSALAIHSVGSAIGILLGLALGGWLADTIGWKATLIAFAIPGLALAVILPFFFREPKRGQSDEMAVSEVPPRLPEVFRLLRQSKAFFHLAVIFAIGSFVSYGQMQWIPSFLQSRFQMSTTEIGLFFGLSFSIGVALGAIAGGVLGDRLSKQNPNNLVKLLYASYISMPIFTLVFLTVDASSIALFAIFLTALAAGVGTGPIFACVQLIVPPDMRATAAAIVMFVSSIIGMGFGPTLVGFIADQFMHYSDADRLRIALICCTSFAVFPVISVFRLDACMEEGRKLASSYNS